MEAAVKNTAEQEELGLDFFEDVNLKVTIPRRPRMRDQVRRDDLLSTQRTVTDSSAAPLFPVWEPAGRVVSLQDQEGQDPARQL